MIDPISLAVGAAILAVGFLTGRLSRRRVKDDPAKPVCGCGHSLAEHDRDTDRCHAQIRRDKYDSIGDWVGHTWVPCTCRRYVGPQPVESLWMPPITGAGEGRR